MSEICYNCFAGLESGGVCPRCGYDPAKDEGRYHDALRPGSILNGRYITGRVLHQSRCVTSYVAQDYQSGERICIRECFPSPVVARAEDKTRAAIMQPGYVGDFRTAKSGLLSEAKMLAKFNIDDRIVNVRSYFEENNTAYIVTDYIDGVDLSEYIRENGGKLAPEKAWELLSPVADTLGRMHSESVIHRNIAPETIIVGKDGAAKLVGFGEARDISAKGYVSLTEIISEIERTGDKHQISNFVQHDGFSPSEQYSRASKQGFYTDVYSLAAVIYYAVTGRVPQDALERMENDTLLPPGAYGVALGSKAEAALMKALSVSSKDRYQTVKEFTSDFRINTKDRAGVRPAVEKSAAAPAPAAESTAKKSSGGGWFVTAAVCLLLQIPSWIGNAREAALQHAHYGGAYNSGMFLGRNIMVVLAVIMLLIGIFRSGKSGGASTASAAKPEPTPGKNFRCTKCGEEFTGWYKTCKSCGAVNSIERKKP